jgi:hypothetical protein
MAQYQGARDLCELIQTFITSFVGHIAAEAAR